MVLDIALNKNKSKTYVILAIITLLAVTFLTPVIEAQSFSGTFSNPNAPVQPPSPAPRPDWAQAPVKSATYSLNWAGYVVASSLSSPSSTVTSVNGSWIVQTVTASKKPTYSAQWVGIGGYFTGDNSLIQTGTSSDSASGATNYYAWYELLPASETQLGSAYPVRPGDLINAFVSIAGTNSWNITINDLTSPRTWHFSIIVTYASSQLSAEWIEERPAIAGSLTTLANFGNAYYGTAYTSVTNTNYATINTITNNIASFANQQVIMVANNGRALATPSALNSGTSFTVQYNGR